MRGRSNYFYYFFSNAASYILEKYSDFLKIKNFSDFGRYNRNMRYNPETHSESFCRHVYEYVYQDNCPDCGRYTHEPNYALDHKLFTEYYKSDKPKEYICPVEGGTIRGWWSI